MKRQFFVKVLFILSMYCGASTSLFSAPIIWEGTPINPSEQLLSGQLTILIDNGVAKGDIGGLSATGVIDNQKQFILSFSPQGTTARNATTGTFRGYFNKDNELRGHWVRYGMQKMAWTPYATPVHFSRSGDEYTGSVEPIKDALSLFFIGELQSKNRYGFTIFIPETNFGRHYRNAELVLDKDKATWFSISEEGKEEVASGLYPMTTEDSFRLHLPYWGGDIHFERQLDDVRGLVAGKRDEDYQAPTQKNDGWPVGKADQFGLDISVLESFANMLSNESPQTPYEAQTEAFLLARNGVLVFERYFRGYDSEQPHDLRSASKSLTGILPGLAEQAGLVAQNKDILKTPIYQTLGFKTDDLKKQRITLEHALSMNTGLDCDDNQRGSPGGEDAMQSQQEELNWFRYILKLDAVHEPGSHTAYCSGGINLAGAVLTAKTQQWMPALIEELFARPLNIKKYHVNLLPDGEQAYSGGGFRLRARDFLKMGQLMLNKGRWGANQLLSPEYVENVLTPRGTMFDKDYGLGWWMNTTEINGRSYRVFAAGGNGGQQILAVPELDMVAVSLGSAYGTRGSTKMRDDWFPNIILKQAIKQSGIKE